MPDPIRIMDFDQNPFRIQGVFALHRRSRAVAMGKRIRALRESARLSQSDIGRMMGLTDAAISMWETGKTEPSLDKFHDLARILGTTPAYLAFGDKCSGHGN